MTKDSLSENARLFKVRRSLVKYLWSRDWQLESGALPPSPPLRNRIRFNTIFCSHLRQRNTRDLTRLPTDLWSTRKAFASIHWTVVLRLVRSVRKDVSRKDVLTHGRVHCFSSKCHSMQTLSLRQRFALIKYVWKEKNKKRGWRSF